MVRRLITLAMLFTIVLAFSFSIPVDRPRLTSSFGEFRGSGNRGPHFHMGVDLSTGLARGKPIYSADRGWLVRIEIDEDDIYGNVVVLEHENDYRTIYAHLSSFSKKLEQMVKSLKEEFEDKRIVVEFPEGEIIFEKGEIVGYSGDTGEASQPHCHFEIRNREETISYNPMKFLEIPRPLDEDIVVKKISINGKIWDYVEGAVYEFSGDFPRLEVNAYAKGFNNVLGLQEIRFYKGDEEIYRISFDEITWGEFNKVWGIYSKKSIVDGYRYSVWYILYPEEASSLVKIDKFPDIGKFPDYDEYRIVLVDPWGEEKTLRFYLKRR
ncbi:MAG: M23 family peptidase [Thermotoga sp.]|nr:MAG: M23 family peptidase [Thermotoga sp.]